MAKALRRYTPGDMASVLVANPDTPISGTNRSIPQDPVGMPVGCRLNSAGMVIETGAVSPQANTVFSPAEMDARLAAITDRIARESAPAPRIIPPTVRTPDDDLARNRRAQRISLQADRGLVTVKCCLCRRELIGLTNTATTVGRTIEKVAYKDPGTLLSYCVGCAAQPTRVKLIDTPPVSGKD
jgi:hypothetical protein